MGLVLQTHSSLTQNKHVYLHQIFTAFDIYQDGKTVTLLYCLPREKK